MAARGGGYGLSAWHRLVVGGDEKNKRESLIVARPLSQGMWHCLTQTKRATQTSRRYGIYRLCPQYRAGTAGQGHISYP